MSNTSDTVPVWYYGKYHYIPTTQYHAYLLKRIKEQIANADACKQLLENYK